MSWGLHIVAYEAAEFCGKFFAPWIEFKKKYPDKILISVSHCVFKEFHEIGKPIFSSDNTHEILNRFLVRNVIDFYSVLDQPLVESDARSITAEPLLKKNVDYLWITALDEIYTFKEIENTISFVEKHNLLQWFRIEYKNLTFNENTYTKGFAPPRIFKNFGPLKIKTFRADDEIIFEKCNGELIDYLQTASIKIPLFLCNPLHYTWLDNPRSREKINYQTKRWGPYGCSFTIENEKLTFNKTYFSKHNIMIPELYYL